MPFMLEPHDLADDVQLITQRALFDRDRSHTLGRDDESLRSVEADEIIDLTFDNSATSEYTLGEGEVCLDTFRIAGEAFRPGDYVELRNGVIFANQPVALLIIKFVTKDHHGQVSIRGFPLVRTRDVVAKLPKKHNEVCQLLQFDNGSATPALLSVNKESIVRKATVIVTNTLWPSHADNSRFACRWNFKIYTVSKGRASKPIEQLLERIPFVDAHTRHRQSDDILCQAWRGGRVVGGSWKGGSNTPVPTVEIDEEVPAAGPPYRQPGQRYTLFDSFAGAGGVSRGAQMAGFKVTHAVDKAPDTWDTYEANFGDVKLFRCAVDEFIVRAGREHIRVDILHLSPPCQYFSPAHTHRSAQDDEHIFALFSCNALINKVRPRLITVEQTFGITHDRHQEYLNILISDFTQFGYSVRWKIVRLCNWGSAQDRKRLVMIAAAPGESLPPFPEATHSEFGVGGTKRFTTIRKALSSVCHRDDLHDLETVRRHRPRKAPYNPDRLSGTICTGGSDSHYFDGSRDFTLRELASLQGFPRYHRFVGTKTSIKRQIGNAFPPNTVKVLYQHLHKWLVAQDGVLPCPGPEAVIIDALPGDEARIIGDSDDLSDVNQPRSGASSPELIDISDDAMEIDEDFEAGPAGAADCVMVDLT